MSTTRHDEKPVMVARKHPVAAAPLRVDIACEKTPAGMCRGPKSLLAWCRTLDRILWQGFQQGNLEETCDE